MPRAQVGRDLKKEQREQQDLQHRQWQGG